MSADERVAVALERASQRRGELAATAVSHGHAHVAHEARPVGAPNGARGEEREEAGLVEREEALERPALQLARVDPRLARRRREPVPGARLLAEVAAEDPVAHERPELA